MAEKMKFEFPRIVKQYEIEKIEAALADVFNKLSEAKGSKEDTKTRETYKVQILKADFGDCDNMTTSMYDYTELHIKLQKEIDSDFGRSERQ